MEEFRIALASGNLAGLTALIAVDAELVSDGGGKRIAARNVIVGADRIARYFFGITRHKREQLDWQLVRLNGTETMVGSSDDEVTSIMSLATDGTAITGIYMQRNPDKIAGLASH